MDKEKLIQIYEIMADITLANLNKIKEADTTLDDSDISMISATLQLYNATADNHQQEMLFTPEDSSGTKYSPESIGIPCPIADREQCQ